MPRLSKNHLLHLGTLVLMAVVVLGTIGAMQWIEQANRSDVRKSLKTALDSAHQSVADLFHHNLSIIAMWAADPRVGATAQTLASHAHDRAALLAAPERRNLDAAYRPLLDESHYEGYEIVGLNGTVLASDHDAAVGRPAMIAHDAAFFARAVQGEALISVPMASTVPLIDRHGHAIEGLATMFGVAPIKTADGRVLALAAMRILPDHSFGPIFQRSRFGETGETYAITDRGRMLSESRFNEQLVAIGLLDDAHHADLKIEVRDPGVDLTSGAKAQLPRDQQPLTTIAASIAAHQTGDNLHGYRDYRGIEVVGAWVWDDGLGFGVATEIDTREAYDGMRSVEWLISFAAALLMLAMGALWRLVIVMREEAEARTALAIEAQTAAEEANTAKSGFLSSMSHELRTPLNAILGFAQLLEYTKPALTAQQLDQVRDIRKGGEHLLSLINDVLDLSKIEAGKLDISIEPVALDDVVGQCVSLIEPQLGKYGVTLENRVGASGFMVRSDHLRLRQCLLNFMSNACKYNRKGGRVTISAEPRLQYGEHGWLRLAIADTGIGIPERHQANLFEPFNRLGAASSGVEGTGIGLSLTKTLIENMGGRVGYVSVEGQGSTFWIDMPLAETTATEKRRDETRIHPSRDPAVIPRDDRGGALILYVEDNQTNVRIVEGVLKALPGIRLIAAPSAEDGIDMAQAEQPDLILMDGTLPGMSGLACIRRLKALDATKHIPIIGLSANAQAADCARAMEAGCKDYLTKPIDVRQLLATVSKTLGERADG